MTNDKCRKRRRHSIRNPQSAIRNRSAFTLVEVLIAAALSLALMAVVAQLFGDVASTVAETRSTIQTVASLRALQQTLREDLRGATAELRPPLSRKDPPGYFEIIEGVIGARYFPSLAALNSQNTTNNPLLTFDSTLGDIDDILMLTTESDGPPFVGRYLSPQTGQVTGGFGAAVTATSQTAEVCYFVRGNTLYRRVLLVCPTLPLITGPGYYAFSDISARQVEGPYTMSPNPITAGTPMPGYVVANTLDSLKDRKNRYGHQPFCFPYDARFWGALGLPTIRESTFFYGTVFPWPFPLSDLVDYPLWGAAVPVPWGSSLAGNGPASPLIFPASPTQVVQPTTWPAGLPNTYPQIPQIYTTQQLGTVYQSGYQTYPTGTLPPAPSQPGLTQFDAWLNPGPLDQTDGSVGLPPPGTVWTHPLGNGSAINGFSESNPNQATLNPQFGNLRVADDVVMTNVLSFDVKVWDPNAAVVAFPGIDGAPGVVGFDDDGDGAVDDASELGADGSDDLIYYPGDVYVPTNKNPATGPVGVAWWPPVQGTYPTPLSAAGTMIFTAPTLAAQQFGAMPNEQYLYMYTLAVNNALNNVPPLTNLPQIIGYGAYVDLGYAVHPLVNSALAPTFGKYYNPGAVVGIPNSRFCGPGDFRSQLWAGGLVTSSGGASAFYNMAAVYDTGTTVYEEDGLDQDLTSGFNYLQGVLGYTVPSYGPDQQTNGIDDVTIDNGFVMGGVAGVDDVSGEPYIDANNNGMYDPAISPPELFTDLNLNTIYDYPESEAPPPYRARLRGIQIKIRVFEPDSQQIREVTVVQQYVDD